MEGQQTKRELELHSLELTRQIWRNGWKSGSAKKDGEEDLWNLTWFYFQGKSENEYSPGRPASLGERLTIVPGRCLSQRWKSRRSLLKIFHFPLFLQNNLFFDLNRKEINKYLWNSTEWAPFPGVSLSKCKWIPISKKKSESSTSLP